MIERFLPHERHASVYSIEYQKLWQCGIRGLVFDLDNTLGPHRFSEPEEKLVQLINQLSDHKFRAAFLSNHNGQGREHLEEHFKNVTVLFNAQKPLRDGYQKVLELFELKPEQTAMIGDQLFTDIWGAKRCGLYTILVSPVAPQSDPISIRGRRWLEKFLLR